MSVRELLARVARAATPVQPTDAWEDRRIPLPGLVRSLLSTPTRRRLASGAFWNSAAGLVSRVLAMITSFLIARLIGRQRFGEYGMIMSTVNLVQTLATMGVGMTATKFTAEFRIKDRDRAGRFIGISTLLTLITGGLAALVLLAFSPSLAAKTLAAPHLAGMLRLSSLAVLLGVISSVQICTLAGFEAFRASASMVSLTGCIQSVLMFIGCYFAGLPGLIVAFTLAMCTSVALGRFLLTREMKRFDIKVNWSATPTEWHILYAFSLPAFLASVLVEPVLWVSSAILAHQPDGYGELGGFNAANQWFSAVQFLPTMIGTAFLPVLSERYGSGDRSGTLRLMFAMIGITAAIVVPICGVLCLMSRTIMSGYGPTFASFNVTLMLTVITAALMSTMTPVGLYIAASNRMWVGFTMNLGWAIVLLTSTVIMIRWGANGLAASRLLAYAVLALSGFGFVLLTSRSQRTQHGGPGSATSAG
jgi:O-antigen/teichoic acid export membrane protein